MHHKTFGYCYEGIRQYNILAKIRHDARKVGINCNHIDAIIFENQELVEETLMQRLDRKDR